MLSDRKSMDDGGTVTLGGVVARTTGAAEFGAAAPGMKGNEGIVSGVIDASAPATRPQPIATSAPGYNSVLPKNKEPLAEILKLAL